MDLSSCHELLPAAITYSAELRRFLQSQLPNPADAQDLLQELYLAVIKVQPGRDVRHVKAYLFTIAANLAHQPSNLFGDILSDLGPACTGTIGIAPSGSINPEREFPSLFEPVHGSAPDIAGRGTANPVGQIWSAAMMLDHLGEPAAAAAIVRAIESVLASPRWRTADLGGSASTVSCGKAISEALS
jgi:isocitrate/isopropylmalate dehydrogenase